MKVIVKKILKFSLMPLILFLVFGIYMQKDQIYSQKRKLFEANKNDIKCLILGSSHTYWGIKPTLFPIMAVNIAENDKPILIDISLLKKHILSLKELKYVVIPLDYFTFYYDGSNEPNQFRYFHHWGLKNDNLKPYSLKAYHLFTCGISWDENQMSFDSDSSFGYSKHTHDFSKEPIEKKVSDCKIRMNRWEENWIDTSLSRKIFTEIVEFTLFLKEKNVETIFIKMPVTKIFYGHYDKLLEESNNYMTKKLLLKTGSRYINLQDFEEFNNESLFNDIDHLNDQGAIIATNILVSNILPIKSNNN